MSRQCNFVPSRVALQNVSASFSFSYGLGNEEALVQGLGSVSTVQGRALAWPNTLQHCVSGFSLADASKPGFRKILVFWLVDPTKRIVSTSIVPPQQEEWWTMEMKSSKVSSLRPPQVVSTHLKFN